MTPSTSGTVTPTPKPTASPTPSVTPNPVPTPSPTLTDTQPVDTTQAAARLGWGTPYTGDEFGYIGSPDPTRWSVYNSAGHAGKGLRRPSQWTVNGQYARVTGLPNGTTGGMSFKPDRGSTSGRWEVRMRTTRQPAYHSVLIVWPDAGRQAVPGCQEIDFSESTKTVGVSRFYLHHTCPNYTTTASRTLDMTQWHHYAVEWTPTRITGYIDGIEFYEDTRYAPNLRAPSHLTAQLDWFPGNGATTINSTMDLDWVRVYRLNSTGPTVAPSVTPTPSATAVS